MSEEHTHNDIEAFLNKERGSDWYDDDQAVKQTLSTLLKHISEDGTRFTPPEVSTEELPNRPDMPNGWQTTKTIYQQGRPDHTIIDDPDGDGESHPVEGWVSGVIDSSATVFLDAGDGGLRRAISATVMSNSVDRAQRIFIDELLIIPYHSVSVTNSIERDYDGEDPLPRTYSVDQGEISVSLSGDHSGEDRYNVYVNYKGSINVRDPFGVE